MLYTAETYPPEWVLQKQKGWLQRTFSPMSEGSLRGCVFTLMASAFGSGMLSLSYGLAENGLVPGAILILISGLLAYFTLDSLAKVAARTKSRNYNELVEKVFGLKIKYVTSFMISLYCYGTLIGYNIILSEIIRRVLRDLGVSCSLIDNKTASLITIAIANAIDTYMYLRKDLSFLRYLTLVNVFFIALISIIVMVESPIYFEENTEQYDFFRWNPANLLTFYAVTCYAYICHANLVPVVCQLKYPTRYRMKKIILRAVWGMLMTYIALSFCGYFSFGENTPSLIIFRPGLGKTDWAMVIGSIGFGITMIFALPLTLNPGSEAFLSLIYGEKERNKIVSAITKLIYGYTSALLAVYFTDIIAAFSIIGGFTGSYMAILIPGVAYYIILEKERKIKRIAVLSVSIFFTVLGFSAAILTIYQLAANGISSPDNICPNSQSNVKIRDKQKYEYNN